VRSELRVHHVSVRVNDAELQQLDERRAPLCMQRGEFLRCAALHKLPPTIPPLNRQAWEALARGLGNLNQITHAVNLGQVDADLRPQAADLRQAFAGLRAALIGVNLFDAED
jgi:hypothetical protein